MKFTITMKDPDGVFESLYEAVKADVEKVEGLSEDERDALREQRTQEQREKMKKWIEYGEYLVVQMDTDAMTCVVVPNK